MYQWKKITTNFETKMLVREQDDVGNQNPIQQSQYKNEELLSYRFGKQTSDWRWDGTRASYVHQEGNENDKREI